MKRLFLPLMIVALIGTLFCSCTPQRQPWYTEEDDPVYLDGYQAGSIDGYVDGYSDGYDEGYSDALSDYGIVP